MGALRDGGEIHLCPGCEGAGGESWTDAAEMTFGYDTCGDCKGSGLILRMESVQGNKRIIEDRPWVPNKRGEGVIS
ncbi:hypothetical protein IZ6_25250 [Terrihabitans soli]|uniref:Uncharacterized protein n=1 Tax=Terrihabitans soli TaxID=708113 RepID=A0A6S6QXM7_9HYPH|nr:hypothetical protein [Terrihabitans soli]BCJ91790.1 hypothetical protein IZ6_25250 [Terrihabitans soli]